MFRHLSVFHLPSVARYDYDAINKDSTSHSVMFSENYRSVDLIFPTSPFQQIMTHPLSD